MKWRKWNIIIHRDLGYLCFGLTILYVISGVAVNHIQCIDANGAGGPEDGHADHCRPS